MILDICIGVGIVSGFGFGGSKLLQRLAIRQANLSIQRTQVKQEPPLTPAPELPRTTNAYQIVEKFDPFNGKQRFTAQFQRPGSDVWETIDYWWDKDMTLTTIREHKAAELRRIENARRSLEPPIIHAIP